MKLTQKTATEHEWKPGEARFYQDDKVSGLSLRINEGGTRTWNFAARVAGKWKVAKLGTVQRGMSLEQAREKCIALWAHINAGGTVESFLKPVLVTTPDGPTFADLETAYVAHSAATKSPRTIADDAYHLRRHVPQEWRKRSLTSFTRGEIEKLRLKIKAESGKPRTDDREMFRGNSASNQVVRLLRSMFNWGFDNNYRATQGRDDNPARIKMLEERQVERFLSKEEVGRLQAALMEEPLLWKTYFPTLLYSGFRKNECAKLKWEWIDFAARVVTLPRTKNKKSFRKPLPESVLRMLETLPNRAATGYVFPGKTGGHVIGIQKAWTRIIARAGLENLRIHDLRHSFASFMVNAGFSLPVIAKALNHTTVKTTERYSHLAEDMLREAQEVAIKQIAAPAE